MTRRSDKHSSHTPRRASVRAHRGRSDRPQLGSTHGTRLSHDALAQYAFTHGGRCGLPVATLHAPPYNTASLQHRPAVGFYTIKRFRGYIESTVHTRTTKHIRSEVLWKRRRLGVGWGERQVREPISRFMRTRFPVSPPCSTGRPGRCHTRTLYFSHSLRSSLFSRMRKRFSPGTLQTKPSSAPPVTGEAPTAKTSSSPSTQRGLHGEHQSTAWRCVAGRRDLPGKGPQHPELPSSREQQSAECKSQPECARGGTASRTANQPAVQERNIRGRLAKKAQASTITISSCENEKRT